MTTCFLRDHAICRVHGRGYCSTPTDGNTNANTPSRPVIDVPVSRRTDDVPDEHGLYVYDFFRTKKHTEPTFSKVNI